MKDDLVEGQQVPRTDDLECQEMMAIQLDEARDFLTRETVAHALWRSFSSTTRLR